MTVGDRIHSKRVELGLSQRELGGPGVSYAYISRIEAGARNPSVKALRKIAPKLGVTVHWLETGQPDPVDELRDLVADLTTTVRRYVAGDVGADELSRPLDAAARILAATKPDA